MKGNRTAVSDHAILRYMQRVQGFDIERLRLEIGRRVHAGASTGASAVIIDGFAYILGRDAEGVPTVTTVLPHQPGEGRIRPERWRK